MSVPGGGALQSVSPPAPVPTLVSSPHRGVGCREKAGSAPPLGYRGQALLPFPRLEAGNVSSAELL